ncbi:flagellar protein [Bacillus methanolicus]|uniref:flagellin N-terminal helical domain-containing protein n=1 Tax=Bacillus methanolicus TaxID=1471 RepID=UPI0023805AA5|nr:flagellin [Bacillus methanolicus]MDE3840151.1 flagellar protein [Bacillus methanolicus]
MRINHNIQALNAYRNLSQTMFQTSKSLEKLSSGLRINRAADDAAGLAISEKMRSQIRGLNMAERNTLDAISLIQTGEGALGEVHSILQRMRELSVQAANGTLEEQDRQAIQDEINQLTQEIDRIADTTQFNQKKLFSGSEKGRAFADINSSQVNYTGNGVWKGLVTAIPTDPASVVIDFSKDFGALTTSDLEGKTFTINGKTYEIDITDGSSSGVTGNNIAVNLTTAEWKTISNDTDIKDNINTLMSKLKSAIEDNDGTLFNVVKVDAVDDADPGNGTIQNGTLTLTTKNNMSPKDAKNIAVNTDFLATDGVQFVDPADSTTSVTTFVAKENALNANSFTITFSEMPKAGDKLVIDGLTIDFIDTTAPAPAYTSGTSAQINIKGKDIFKVLDEIKGILTKAQLDTTNEPVKNLANTFDVVGTTLILGTTFTEDTPPVGLEIELHDGDFEANKGKDLSLEFQIGANSSESLAVSISVMDAASLGIGRNANGTPTAPGFNAQAGVDVMSVEAARAAIDIFDNAIKLVSTERSKLGAIQNRLEHTTNNLQTANENLTSAESRIRDLDMAEEMTNFTRNNILNQAGQAMLAQSNQLPQGILQLLK